MFLVNIFVYVCLFSRCYCELINCEIIVDLYFNIFRIIWELFLIITKIQNGFQTDFVTLICIILVLLDTNLCLITIDI